MEQRYVVMAAAWLEIVVGAICLIAFDVPCRLLFGARAEGIAMPLARFAGVALVALGIACLPSAVETRRGAVHGLFAFNLGVAVLLVWVGVATTLHGMLLWPAVILHAVIAGALLPQLLSPGAGISAASSHQDRRN